MALPRHPRSPSGQWWMRARPGGRACGPSSATSPGGSFRQHSNVNLGVVEAHRKVPQGRGARWPTSHITRGLGRAPQTTPDSVALDTVATLTPKHTRMDDFCAWHIYGFVTLGTLHINGCMSHSHHITFNYSFGAFISRNLTAQLSKLTENGSKRCLRAHSS